jgi:DNA helicase IV/energy-coupling factor transporter ATP-binding protein EcfA2
MSVESQMAVESNYLEFVKENIQLRKEEILEVISNPNASGINHHTSGAIRRHHENIELPNPNAPYFVRVDFRDGESAYYGFSTLRLANKSKPIPSTHSGISYWLTYSRNNDKLGYSVLPLDELAGKVISRTVFTIKNGSIREIRNTYLESNTDSESKVQNSDLVKETMQETRTEGLQLVGPTLQPDQFKLTREPIGLPLIVQGPPGSGKTAVLLERLSRIAFSNKAVKDRGMLLIGPNDQFLDYVGSALETLGNSEIITSTIEDLGVWKFQKNVDNVKEAEDEAILKVKGDIPFLTICDNMIQDLPNPLETNYIFKLEEIEVTFSVLDSFKLLSNTDFNSAPYNQLRQRISLQILNVLTERFFLEWESKGRERSRFNGDPKKSLESTSSFKTLLRNLMPEVSAEALLKRLKKSPRDFIKYAKDVEFSESNYIESWLEVVAPADFQILRADIPILSYLDFKINGNSSERWGHIAIDEAQDLTPMQLNMIVRYSDNENAFSLTGDLAQATGPIYYENWDALSQYLSSTVQFTYRELTMSYRVPSEILNYAKLFLEITEVDVSPAEPVFIQEGSLHKIIIPNNGNELLLIDELITSHLTEGRSVLFVGASQLQKNYEEAQFSGHGAAHFKSYLATDVKGFEFDVVIIHRPEKILKELNYEGPRAARLFYVLTTRATKSLYILGETRSEVDNPVSSVEENDDFHLPDEEYDFGLNESTGAEGELVTSTIEEDLEASKVNPQAIRLPDRFILNDEMQRCVDLVQAGKNVFITGNAGTGKSTLLTYLRQNVLPEDTAVAAPTGVGAINVGGVTLHRLCSFPMEVTFEYVASEQYQPKARDAMKAMKVLIIDEVSMVRADMMDYVDQALRRYGNKKGEPFGGAQLILIGDLAQLPPVVAKLDEREFLESRYNSEFFFDSAVMNEIDYEVVSLETIYRQDDPELVSTLNAIRNNTAKEEHFDFLRSLIEEDFQPGLDDLYITLATTNRKANEINKSRLQELEGKLYRWEAKITGNIGKNDKPNVDTLFFKKNAQIMMINNDLALRWANGTLATITDVKLKDPDEKPHLMIRILGASEDYQLFVHEWEVLQPGFSDGVLKYETNGSFYQFPFILAWAVTIHKSQGKTFDKVIIDLSQKAFSSGQLYVALSRCTTAAGIVLRQEVTPDQVMIHDRVSWYMKEKFQE